nr:SUMF1/EgtB/PvdO family nonheme iron enzyme [Burkholderiales bacterium]
SRANTWGAGKSTTVPVDSYYQGCTPNGIYQLIGNTWEWVAARFSFAGAGEYQVGANDEFGEIRGGAFDTYFDTQSTLGFRTGHPLKYRGPNVGFRCCIPIDRLPSRR